MGRPLKSKAPNPLEWEHGKIVELNNGSWWVALYYRDSTISPWKPCWRDVVTHARYEPFKDFVLRTGDIRGYARTQLPASAFENEEVS